MFNLLENFGEKKYLLAVSGGVDSMVLLELFRVSKLNFQVAHVNYKLRGEDSDSDENLVSEFCKKHQIKLHKYEVSEKDDKPEGSIQLWARDLRYRFFRRILEDVTLDVLVTAHHLNDQLETFLINLSRGSGIKGLSGIPSAENDILRPLLPFSKDEIYRFAEAHKIDFREDSSNQKNDYLRNKIRNEIIPKLMETNENFLDNFRKSIRILNQNKTFTEEQIQQKRNNLSEEKDGKIIFSKTDFAKEADFVKYEILKAFGFSDEKEIGKIFQAKTGRTFSSNYFELAINRNEIILQPISENVNEDEIHELKINSRNEIIFPAKIKKEIATDSELEWFFDHDKIHFPLILRHKKEGDVFYPIGMTGKKKVSKFYKDEKISILAKPKIWLLCGGNNDVLGILPFRQDRRFAADQKTRNVLKLIIRKSR